MKIAILCTDPYHPVMESLKYWKTQQNKNNHQVKIYTDKSELESARILFLVSCGQMITEQERQSFEKVLVLHASDLPEGRGWSPHIWRILEGESVITVSVLEASDPVDTGDIWAKQQFSLDGHELLPEINEKLFQVELNLMSYVVTHYQTIQPRKQTGFISKTYPKRTPENSRLELDLSLRDQINLLRVVDNQRYPAFFEYQNQKYILRIDKVES